MQGPAEYGALWPWTLWVGWDLWIWYREMQVMLRLFGFGSG